jgi:hypothetical protein
MKSKRWLERLKKTGFVRLPSGIAVVREGEHDFYFPANAPELATRFALVRTSAEPGN